jgi:hypothetical protein
MVERTRRRIAALGPEFLARVRFVVGDVRGFEARTDGYDLIVNHFFSGLFFGRGVSEGCGASSEVGEARGAVDCFGFS